MGFFSRKTEEPAVNWETIRKEAEEAEAKEQAEAPIAKEMPINKTKIGAGITFVGNFDTEDPIEVNGCILGDIKSTSTVEITTSGTYKGNACIDTLLLCGNADGNVDCKDLAKLSETANMTGNLTSARLVTEEGSNFDGNMKLVSARAKAAAAAAEKAAEEAAMAAEAAETAEEAPAEAEEKADEEFIFG